MERPPGSPPQPLLIEGRRRTKEAIARRNGDEAVQGMLVPIDLLQILLHNLDAGDLAILQKLLQFDSTGRERVELEIVGGGHDGSVRVIHR